MTAVSGPDRAWLDQLEALRQAASKHSWGLLGGTHDRTVIDDHGCHVASTGTFPDAALIVAAVNALPSLLAAARERDALRAAVERLTEELGRDAWNICGTEVSRERAVIADRLRAAVADTSVASR